MSVERHPDGRVFHGQKGGAFRPNNALDIFVRTVVTPLSEKFPTPPGEIGFEAV